MSLTDPPVTAVSLVRHPQVRLCGSPGFSSSDLRSVAFVYQGSIPWGVPVSLTLT